MTIHETYVAALDNERVEYGFMFKEDADTEDSLFELILGQLPAEESHLIPDHFKANEWIASAFVRAYGNGEPAVGYQVVNADGECWASRESFEILHEQLAMSDLKHANYAGGDWSLQGVRDGAIQNPSFVGFPSCDAGLDVGLCAAMISALACEDKGFSRAGISFVQNGGVTLVQHQGYTVAMVVGRFDVATVVSQIRTNIGKHARDVMAVLSQALSSVNWPANHVLSLDMAQNMAAIVNRGSCKITAYAGGVRASSEQFHADFNFHLGECRATIQMNAGARFGCGVELIGGQARDIRAPNYSALISAFVHRVNRALSQVSSL